MDQNTPRDEATGGQPNAASGSGDAGAWNQAPPQDQAQPAAGADQEAQAEYAAWSADASYQQAANPADTQAYAAPEPQSATYADQPAAQQQAYDQQQYQQQQQQQAYDQQAYQQQYQQQQPQAYDQQAYQQQYQQPPQAYDQQAYPQQQQPQQPQQPQYYDPSVYGQQPQQYQQPQYYDQSAYGQQQPGYYDQSAYGQQQPYQQQPPYAYAQPGQDQYYAEGEGGYGRSFLAVLAGWVLLTWGFVWGIAGALVLYAQSITDWLGDIVLSSDVDQLIADVEATEERVFAFGGILVIIGIIHIIAAVGIFGHRRWGRAFGIILGLLGILAALGIFTISAGFEALDVGLDEAVQGEESSVAASLFVLACYGLVFIGMITGRRHFKKKGVSS